MPTYEYVCHKCNHQFDFSQSIRDNPIAICPKERCAQKTWGKGKVKRMVSAGAGLIFKGSGFYITDYRSKEYKEAAKKDSATTSTSSTPSTPKESKPASPTPKSDSGASKT